MRVCHHLDAIMWDKLGFSQGGMGSSDKVLNMKSWSVPLCSEQNDPVLIAEAAIGNKGNEWYGSLMQHDTFPDASNLSICTQLQPKYFFLWLQYSGFKNHPGDLLAFCTEIVALSQKKITKSFFRKQNYSKQTSKWKSIRSPSVAQFPCSSSIFRCVLPGQRDGFPLFL